MTKNIEIGPALDKAKSLLWVIVKSDKNLFGFDANFVGSMLVTPTITRVPNRINYMLGTITVRDSVIPLVDLRVYTGRPSATQEIDIFCQLMDQRLNDHQNWLKELKVSISEKREFKLATDPHKCAFGKWYDTYKSNDRTIQNILAKFDAPHKVIHGIAEKVTKLVHENNIDAAHEIIDRTSNNELERMVGLFAEIKEAVKQTGRRRIAMVLELEGRSIALDIDEVVSVEYIKDIEDAPQSEARSIGITRIGRKDKSDELVLLMENLEFLARRHHAAAPH